MNDLKTEKSKFSAQPRGSGASIVFEALREEIISLTLIPGSPLSRHVLQDKFALSSTPIRDALLRLQEEGLVDIFPQHTTLVAAIDVTRAERALFLRRSVEIEVVRQIAQRPNALLIEGLNAIIADKENFATQNNYQAFMQADLAFHKSLFDALELGHLLDIVRREGGHIDRLRRLHLPRLGKMPEVIAAHKAIVAAIASQNPNAAANAMREHLSHSLDFVATLRLEHPQFF
jgi:GntR family transcriptional regulator, rspAB operon transcriptional repressor